MHSYYSERVLEREGSLALISLFVGRCANGDEGGICVYIFVCVCLCLCACHLGLKRILQKRRCSDTYTQWVVIGHRRSPIFLGLTAIIKGVVFWVDRMNELCIDRNEK